MKILFLCHFFPPTHTAGAENYTFMLARGLAQQGHDVSVLCAGSWERGARYWNGHSDEVYFGIQVRRLHLCWYKAPDPNRYLYENPETAAHLRDWLREQKPDVVHITSCYTLSASVIGVCEDAGIPVIVTLVDFWFLCPSIHLLRSDGQLCDGKTTAWECLRCMLDGTKALNWSSRVLPERGTRALLTMISEHPGISRQRGFRGMALNMEERKRFVARQLRKATMVLAPSRYLAELHADVVSDLDIMVQEYGHDLSWLPVKRTVAEEGVIRVCYLGQISHDKGVHVLVEAMLQLEDLEVSLDVWGSLNEASSYGRRIAEAASRSSKIVLRGRFPREQLSDVLGLSDVVVVPSLWYENNPLVIQEAFAARIPVIATNLGGMAEFVKHEVNGLLFERGDSGELAHRIRSLVEKPELLEALREGIPEVKSIETEVDQLLTLYGRCLP